MFSDITHELFPEIIPEISLEALPEANSRMSLLLRSANRLPEEHDEQESLLDALITQSHDAILIAESDSPDFSCFRLIYANPAFVQLGLGQAVRGLRLCHALSVFSEALTAPAFLAHVRASLTAGLPVREEPVSGWQDGQSRHARLDIVPIARGAKACRWLVTLHDVTGQMQVEEALHQTQDRYRMLAEAMADVVSLHDPDGRFLYVTPSIFRLTGFTVEETLACDPRGIVHPDDHAVVFEGVGLVNLDANSHRVEWRRLCRDGSYLWLETTVTVIHDADGAVYRSVCCSRDMTQRKQAEAVLHEEQALLRTLIESLPDHIHVQDRQGRFLLDNEAHRRLLEIGPGEIAGKTVWDLFPNDLAAAYDADDQEVLRTGQPLLNREEPTVTGAGERRWVSTTKTPLFDPDGGIAGLVAISRDITELKRSAEALKESAERYRLLFQANPQSMWVYDIKTLAFLAVNDTAIARYGYTREEFQAMTLADIRPHEDLPVLMQSLGYGPNETQVTGPWRHRRKDGSVIWVEIHSHPLTFNDREARIVVVNNVTERKRMEAEAEQLLAQTKHLLTEAVERADRDPLTGLINHRAFHKRFEQQAALALKTGLPLSLAMMDLDNFKFFNDGYGHSIGDDVLQKVASALREACRPGDTLARFGGDEFALLMPGTDAEQAVRLADRLVAALQGVGYRPPGYDTTIPLSLSIGIAIFPDDGPGRLEALAAADARLIRVKTGGTGREELTDRLRSQLACSLTDFSMLNALVTAVDTKDRYTRRHSEDVMSYSIQIACELGMDERAQQEIMLAALLHDVGKVGVPDRVLRKPGRLTGEEYESIKHHPMMGAIIVGAVPGFEETLDAIRHHHERWDGKGYPFGLRGEDIPLTARLMAVADAFSAMTTDRPYRKGMQADAAIKLLEAGAGTQWDSQCVQAFLTARRKMDGWFDQ